ncbi:hypothetical protein [Azospirillum largimobile]
MICRHAPVVIALAEQAAEQGFRLGRCCPAFGGDQQLGDGFHPPDVAVGAAQQRIGQRFRTMITAKVSQLNGAKPAPRAPDATAWRVRWLKQEAQRLAAEIQVRPVTGTADVLARLDVIAAMWGPDGTISAARAPLAEVLALLDEIARGAPGFQPTWRRCRRAMLMEECKPPQRRTCR